MAAMKFINPLIFGGLTLLALTTNAAAQSPREQLKQMVEQLQQSPSDNVLRGKIIKLGAKTKPSPAIPEDANRAFVKGNVFQKEARNPAGYELAISAYQSAIRVAPWWGDAYFNLAVAQESAGKFDEATASLRLYIASVPAGSAEAREAQNRIYSIEAKGELAAAAAQQAAKANSPQALEMALLQKIEGARFVSDFRNPNPNPEGSFEFIYEVRGGVLHESFQIWSLGSGPAATLSIRGHNQPGLYEIGSAPYIDGKFTIVASDGYGGTDTSIYRIRPDGQALLRGWPQTEPYGVIPRQ